MSGSAFRFSQVILGIIGVLSLIVYPVKTVKCFTSGNITVAGFSIPLSVPKSQSKVCALASLNISLPIGDIRIEADAAFSYPPPGPGIIAGEILDFIEKHVKRILGGYFDYFPEAAVAAINVNGHSGRLFGCITPECNNKTNVHNKKTDEIIASVEKTITSMGNKSEKLQCHNEKDKSIDCDKGYCWMGRQGNATSKYSIRGCFNEIPDGLRVVLGVIKFGEKVIAPGFSKADEGVDMTKPVKKDLIGVIANKTKEMWDKVKDYVGNMDDLRGIAGDHGIAVAALYMNNANFVLTGAYCSSDNCNKKGADLEKSLDVIEDLSREDEQPQNDNSSYREFKWIKMPRMRNWSYRNDSLLALYIPLFILAMLSL